MSYRLLAAMLGIAASLPVAAHQDCTGLRPQEVVACYVAGVRQAPLESAVLEQTFAAGYELRRLHLVSQSWAPSPVVAPQRWEHEVELHIPHDAVPGKALLVVNNGVRHGPAQTPDYSRAALREVAMKTRMAVVMISDVPNQYITFSDVSKPLREDDAVAHTWAHWLRDPAAPAQLPLQVPMAVAASRAMDLAELELGKSGVEVKGFIITGASKRGWSAWLTALADERVIAIVPAVIDVADTSRMLAGLSRRYAGNWPAPLWPYQQSGVLQQLGSAGFDRLMAMIDPMQYLDEPGQRLAMPKYLVSASGDEFFAPDPVTDYQQRMPGQVSLRVLPNSGHGGVREALVSTLVPVLMRLRDDRPLPGVQLSPNAQGAVVEFSEPPVAMRLWTATNGQDRDFRYACGVRYQPESLKPMQRFNWSQTPPASGWQAQFVEAVFADGFIATTAVTVLPQSYPQHAPAQQDKACRTFPAANPA